MEITLSLFRKINKQVKEAGLLHKPGENHYCCRFTFQIKNGMGIEEKWIDINADKESVKKFAQIVDKAVESNVSKDFECLSVSIARKRSTLRWKIPPKVYTTLDEYMQDL